MEQLQIFYLSIVLLVASACSDKDEYTRAYSASEQEVLSRGLVSASGNTAYYQGSPGERALLMDGLKYDSTYGELHRELAIPYLKRGYPDKIHLHYADAVRYDRCNWAGCVAYAYLYFLRDYERCIEHGHMIDQCTPGFTDYP